MKTVFILFISLITIITACKKDKIISGNNMGGGNGGGGNPIVKKAPIANAGPDQYPATGTGDTFFLDGSASTDPDGQIVEWQWSNISGSGNVIIYNPNQSQTNIKVGFMGLFQFELLVKDNDGLVDRDTIAIWFFSPNTFCVNEIRPSINAKLIPFWRFPFERFGMSVTTLGSKVYFAGGRDSWTGSPTAQVVILDMVSKEESQANLSIPRAFIGTIAAGNKIFFAGGWTWSGALSRVEIVDLANGTSKTAELSEPRWSVTTAVLGNKVFFAGGFYWNGSVTQVSSAIDIYDISTDSWSVMSLSEARAEIATTVVNNKIYFAGGSRHLSVSDVIDVYDGQTNSWSVIHLDNAIANPAAITVNNKIYWAGGYKINLGSGGTPLKQPSCRVEIRDLSNQSISSASLIKSTSIALAMQRNNQLIFFPGTDASYSDFFDIYDISSGVWSIGIIGNGLLQGTRFIYNNEIYIAGAYLGTHIGSDTFSSQILKLEL